MSKKTKKEPVYVLKKMKNEDIYTIIKVIQDEGTSIEEAVYTTSKNSCTCRAFQLHGHCKHQDMISTPDYWTAAIDVKTAQAYMKDWVKELKGIYREVWLPEEPYKRDSNERVTEIHVCVAHPIKETSVNSGTWSGKIRNYGIIGVLHVE